VLSRRLRTTTATTSATTATATGIATRAVVGRLLAAGVDAVLAGGSSADVSEIVCVAGDGWR
jgi:hypothetical protein